MSTRLVFFLLLAGMMIASLFSLKLGVQNMSWTLFWQSWHSTGDAHYAVFEYRLPRLLLAILIGAALAVSGVLVQGIIRNPLASPDILGVNHAASLATAVRLWRRLSGAAYITHPGRFLDAITSGGGGDCTGCLLGEPDRLPDVVATAGCEYGAPVADR